MFVFLRLSSGYLPYIESGRWMRGGGCGSGSGGRSVVSSNSSSSEAHAQDVDGSVPPPCGLEDPDALLLLGRSTKLLKN